MENWRYNLENFWLLHRRNIKRYGVCIWAIIAGATTHRHFLAYIALVAAALFFCYDRWLHVWAERGRKILHSAEPKDSK
jgi:hypothetical protein